MNNPIQWFTSLLQSRPSISWSPSLLRLSRHIRNFRLSPTYRPTPMRGLLILAASLFAFDHRFTDLTWGALAIVAGVSLYAGITRRATMIQQNQPANPVIHDAAQRIARRFVYIVQGILREEERADAMQEAYRAAREELEKLPPEKQQLLPIYGPRP